MTTRVTPSSPSPPASLRSDDQPAVARRSRRAEGESDPRAQGNSEGPTARLPAPGLSTASNDQGHPASAGNRPHFHPGTGATRRAASRLISDRRSSAVLSGVLPGHAAPYVP